MITILNSTDYTLPVSTQDAVRNAAVNYGVNVVRVGLHPNDSNMGTMFNIFDEEDNYLFSIDTDGDVIFE